MDPLRPTKLSLRSFLVYILPLGLWGMLWLSLGSGKGDLQGIVKPESPAAFIYGIRAIFPFAAAFAAIILIFIGFQRQHDKRFLFINPLGLAAVYGLVGVVATFLSPNGSVALYWAVAYLTVPLVLWGVVWGKDVLAYLGRLVNMTWVGITVIVLVLFAIAILKLDLGGAIFHPSRLLECSSKGEWNALTSGVLRSSGVGRYAAVAAIFALTGLWRRNWSFVSAVILLASLTLLLFSGSRSAFGGFFVAASLTVLLLGGKKAVVVAGVLLLVLVPLFWVTGIHSTFLNSCIFRTAVSQAKQSQAAQQSTAQSQFASQESESPQAPVKGQASLQEPESPQAPVKAQASLQEPESPQAPVKAQASLREQESDKVPAASDGLTLGYIPDNFFQFTGRTAVWADGLRIFKDSPLLGRGFHGDRIILKAHMHNAFVQALVQTGLIGTLAFMSAIVFGWVLLFQALRRLTQVPVDSKHLVVQCGGVLAFLSVRGITESTGAFFGADWLLLAPILFYLHVFMRAQSGRPEKA